MALGGGEKKGRRDLYLGPSAEQGGLRNTLPAARSSDRRGNLQKPRTIRRLKPFILSRLGPPRESGIIYQNEEAPPKREKTTLKKEETTKQRCLQHSLGLINIEVGTGLFEWEDSLTAWDNRKPKVQYAEKN